MAEFAYNNAKNTSTSHIIFKLNCGFYFFTFYKKDVNPQSKLKAINELVTELRELTTVCRENL